MPQPTPLYQNGTPLFLLHMPLLKEFMPAVWVAQMNGQVVVTAKQHWGRWQLAWQRKEEEATAVLFLATPTQIKQNKG